MTRTVGNAAATVRDLVSGSAGSDATRAQAPAGQQSSGPAGTADAGDDIIVAESEPVTDEDTAQADARSQLAEPDDMPESGGFDPADTVATPDDSEAVDGPAETDPTADAPTNVQSSERDGASDDSAAPETDRTVADEPDAERADRPDLSELRRELNDQFESIRVVEPGQYELNLMELYDREEYIIALQEDGRYSIQVPETWRQADA